MMAATLPPCQSVSRAGARTGAQSLTRIGVSVRQLRALIVRCENEACRLYVTGQPAAAFVRFELADHLRGELALATSDDRRAWFRRLATGAVAVLGIVAFAFLLAVMFLAYFAAPVR